MKKISRETILGITLAFVLIGAVETISPDITAKQGQSLPSANVTLHA